MALKSINPTATKAWEKLDGHIYELEDTSLKELFEKDPDRFGKYHLTHGEILVDFSKNLVTDKTMKLLYCIPRSATEATPRYTWTDRMLCRKSTPCWKR